MSLSGNKIPNKLFCVLQCHLSSRWLDVEWWLNWSIGHFGFLWKIANLVESKVLIDAKYDAHFEQTDLCDDAFNSSTANNQLRRKKTKNPFFFKFLMWTRISVNRLKIDLHSYFVYSNLWNQQFHQIYLLRLWLIVMDLILIFLTNNFTGHSSVRSSCSLSLRHKRYQRKKKWNWNEMMSIEHTRLFAVVMVVMMVNLCATCRVLPYIIRYYFVQIKYLFWRKLIASPPIKLHEEKWTKKKSLGVESSSENGGSHFEDDARGLFRM